MTGVDDRIEKLSDAKRRLLEARLRAANLAQSPQSFPASLAQRRLWFIDRLLGSSAVYNSAHAIRFRGPLEPGLLREALNATIARQQSLRLSFRAGPDGPTAIASAPFEFEVPLVDLSELSHEARSLEASRMAVELGRQPFDLSKPPLLRAALLRLSAEEHLLILVIHHIVSDRWSVGVLLRELAAHYDAAGTATPAQLPKLPISYGQFARWQREQAGSDALAGTRQYWLETLRDSPVPLEIPTDRPRGAMGGQAGAVHTWRLSADTTRAVESLGREHGATAYMAFAAAFQVLLHRYTGRRDILIGTPLAGRTRVEAENLIGLFVNMLPLRVEVDPRESFLQLLGKTKIRSLELLAHQELPFEQLVEELKVSRALNRSPLFDVVFNFHNVPFEAAAPKGLSVGLEEVDLGFSRFDFTMLMRPDGAGGMTCSIEYSTDLFDHSTIERTAGHFGTLVAGILAGPNQPISTLPVLTAPERVRILDDWSGARVPVVLSDRKGPAGATHELFEEVASQHPTAPAVFCGNERLNYAELNARANRLAHYLGGIGVTPDTPVGVCLNRSVRLPMALLAVWKSGDAYVPIDPAYPRQRVEAMLDDTRPPVIVAERATAAAIPARPDQRVLILDDLGSTLAGQSCENPPPMARPENLAYVIFTSGSTGRPKGVAVEHRGVLALAAWMKEAFPASHVGGVLAAASASFDMSLFEFLLAFTRGGAVVLVDNVLQVSDAPAADQITFMICAPSAMSELLRGNRLPRSLKSIALGAENVPESLVKSCYALPGVERVYNLYGPSEDSIVSTACVVGRDHPGPPPIGTPLPGSVVYILDANLQPVPVGVTGELYIGGVKLARGYVNRADLTAERLMADPFSHGWRLYRTGDLCKWNADGSIQYVGRADRQVKLRGFRIELEEIESALGGLPGVRQAAAALRGGGGNQQLVGYVVVDGEFDVRGVRDQLARHLPGYMLPASIVRLDAMPLSPNGKTDRGALPNPDSAPGALPSAFASTPPRDEFERRLVEIWKELLNTESVGVHDSFFDLGGHSLLAVRLVDRISQSFKQSLPLAKLFTAPTIAKLAEILRQGGVALEDDVLVPLRAKGEWRPMFCVPGIFNDAFTFEPLTQRLDKRQPLYGLLLQGLATRGGVPTTVEAMAGAFIQQIREVQPHGPYRLGGYSFGGLVAHEMAVQLTGQGEKVELLVQFDSFAPSAARQRPLYQRLFLHLRRFIRKTDGRWEGFHGIKNTLQSLGVASGSPASNLSPLEVTVRAACETARRAHQSRTFDGKVLLLRATVREDWRDFLVKASDNGWTELATGGLEIRDVDGGHLNLLQDQHVERLAGYLNEYLSHLAHERESLNSV